MNDLHTRSVAKHAVTAATHVYFHSSRAQSQHLHAKSLSANHATLLHAIA